MLDRRSLSEASRARVMSSSFLEAAARGQSVTTTTTTRHRRANRAPLPVVGATLRPSEPRGATMRRCVRAYRRSDVPTIRRSRPTTCIIATGHDDEAACRALSRSSGDDEAANGGGARGRRLRRGRARPAHVRRCVAARACACAASASAGGNSAKRKTAPFRTTRISAPCSLVLFRSVGWVVGWLGGCRDISSSDAQSRARPAAPSQQPSCQAAEAQGRRYQPLDLHRRGRL